MSYLRRNDPYSAKAFNEDAGRIPQPQSLSKKLGTPDASATPPARRPVDLSNPLAPSNPLDQNSKIPELIAASANSNILPTILTAREKRLKAQEDRFTTQETLINGMPVTDQNGRVKSGLRAALEGLAEMFDPRYGSVKDWGDLAARAAGGVGRGIGGAINPAWDEKADKEKARVKFRTEYEQYSKDVDAEVNHAAKVAEIQNKETDNRREDEKVKSRERISERNSVLRQIQTRRRYKRGENPEFDEKLNSLDIEQSDFEPDKKIKPRYWDNKTGKLMTFDDHGATIPVTREDGSEVINDSKKEVESGGYTVMPGVARNADAVIEGSRVSAGNDTLKNKRDYEISIAKLDSKIASSSTRITGIQSALAKIGTPTTKEAYSQKIQLDKDLREEQAELAGYQKEKALTPKPVEVEGRTGKTVSTSELESFANSKKWTIKQAEEYAKQNGWTIK